MNGVERIWAVAVSLVLPLAMLWPLVRGSDGFPLSNYPMFARKRGDEALVYHAVGFTGTHGQPLPPAILQTDEVMQAHQTVKLAVAAGRAPALCREVADAVAREPELGAIERVEIRRDVFAVDGYFTASVHKPVEGRTVARCTVSREGER